MCLFVRVCVSVCVCVYVCMYACMDGCMYLWMYVYVYVYMYIYIYCIYIYIYHTILVKKVQFIRMRTQSSVHYELRQPIETTDGRTHSDKQKDRLLKELIDRPKCRQWTCCWMYRIQIERETYTDRHKNVDKQTVKQPCTLRQTNGQTNLYKGTYRRTHRY